MPRDGKRSGALEPARFLYEEIDALKNAVLHKHADMLLKRRDKHVRACEWAIGRLETTTMELDILDRKFDDSVYEGEQVLIDMYREQMIQAKEQAFMELHAEFDKMHMNLDGVDYEKHQEKMNNERKRNDGAPVAFDHNYVPASFKGADRRVPKHVDMQFDPHKFKRKYGAPLPQTSDATRELGTTIPVLQGVAMYDPDRVLPDPYVAEPYMTPATPTPFEEDARGGIRSKSQAGGAWKDSSYKQPRGRSAI